MSSIYSRAVQSYTSAGSWKLKEFSLLNANSTVGVAQGALFVARKQTQNIVVKLSSLGADELRNCEIQMRYPNGFTLEVRDEDSNTVLATFSGTEALAMDFAFSAGAWALSGRAGIQQA